MKPLNLVLMDPASTIRDAIASVSLLRTQAAVDPRMGIAVAAVKRLQATRFRHCYADMLASRDFGSAAVFFLEELYGDADYAERDQQFARIAGTLTTVFPASVVNTAVELSQLHLLTEELDHQMAKDCLLHSPSSYSVDATVYLSAWHAVGRRVDRRCQLDSVLSMGHQLADLTRKPGLALLLKLMRRPAAAAGLGSLQHFLERGFAIFASMSRSKGKVAKFLSTIEARESEWLETMFADTPEQNYFAMKQLVGETSV